MEEVLRLVYGRITKVGNLIGQVRNARARLQSVVASAERSDAMEICERITSMKENELKMARDLPPEVLAAVFQPVRSVLLGRLPSTLLGVKKISCLIDSDYMRLADSIQPLAIAREGDGAQLCDALPGAPTLADSPRKILKRVGRLFRNDHADTMRCLRRTANILGGMAEQCARHPSDPPSNASPWQAPPVVPSIFESDMEKALCLVFGRITKAEKLLEEVSDTSMRLESVVASAERSDAMRVCGGITGMKLQEVEIMRWLYMRMLAVMLRWDFCVLQKHLMQTLSIVKGKASHDMEERYALIMGLIQPLIASQGRGQPE